MSTVTFTPAVRANVPLLLGFMGSSGSGKTFSAMRVAKGIAGDRPFAVIDTESGRARHYAETFRFDHAELHAPFRPQTYLDGIIAAEEAGYPAIVVDSMSHVWAGDGGVLDWHEEELDRMAGDNWGKREQCKMAAWIKPKVAHKKMVQRLLQLRAHVILCFRAEPKVEMVKEDGKTKIKPKATATSADGWIPICDKMLPYELTASFLLTAEKPGIVKPIKLQEQHRPLVPLDSPITEDAGRALADWARGGGAVPAQPVEKPARPMDELVAAGEAIAQSGSVALQKWWTESLTKTERQILRERIGAWKAAAEGRAAA